MRFAALTMALVLLAGAAVAQNDQSEIVVPPAPTLVPAQPAAPPPVVPSPPPPPGLVQTPLPPVVQSSTPQPEVNPSASVPASVQTSAAPPAPPDVAPVQPNNWVPGHTAVLGLLNKVDGGTSQLSIPVGGQSTVGELQVSVQACSSRPAGQLPDDAVFLTVQSAGDNGTTPIYRGWMVRSAPGATVVGDAGETFRIINCT